MTSLFDSGHPADEPPGGRPEIEDPQPLGERREDGGTIGERVGRDPSNLGDEVPSSGDIQHPTPEPGGSQI